MKIYMTTIFGVNATSAPTEVEVEQMEVGDLVLGIVGIHGSVIGELTSQFASVVTAGTTPGIGRALIQNSNDLSNVTAIALMQRGNLQI